MTFLTAQGQMLDLITAPIGTVRRPPARTQQHRSLQVDLSRYTLPTYMRIVTYKTAYYSFYLPVAAGLLLGGVSDPKALKLAEDICVEMGQYFQVCCCRGGAGTAEVVQALVKHHANHNQIQDDYLDCYADAEVLGKVGTDIEDNKCSWLIVQALQRATPEQKKVFEVRLSGYGVFKASWI